MTPRSGSSRSWVAATPSAAGQLATGYARELAESLDALENQGVLRINCGGGEYRGSDGSIWLADRFFTRGFRFTDSPEIYGASQPSEVEIVETDDDDSGRRRRTAASLRWYELVAGGIANQREHSEPVGNR